MLVSRNSLEIVAREKLGQFPGIPSEVIFRQLLPKMVQEAVKRGEDIADGIEKKARAGADETRHKAAQDIEIEAQKAQIELRDDVVSLAIGAAEKVIGERLDDNLHRKLITEYIDGLKPETPEGGSSDA